MKVSNEQKLLFLKELLSAEDLLILNKIKEVNLTLDDISFIEKIKNRDSINFNKIFNKDAYKYEKEYIELKLALNLFPEMFKECKEQLIAKLDIFLEKQHIEVMKIAMQMYELGYKEKENVEQNINQYIKLFN